MIIENQDPVFRSPAQRIAILLLAFFQVAVTALPSFGIGDQIGAQSDGVRTAITPAGWAFAIWGPLYAGAFAFAFYQLGAARRDDAMLARIGWASAGAFLGNGAWALYVQFFGLSFVSVLIILFTLMCLLRCLRAFAQVAPPFSPGRRFLVFLPLSALAAWLTAATIVNVAASLKFHGVDAGSSIDLVAPAIILVGGLIAAAAIWSSRGNPWYASVFLWALAGIYHAEADIAGTDPAAILSALLVVAAAMLALIRRDGAGRWLTGPSS